MDNWPYDDAEKMEAAAGAIITAMGRLDALAALMSIKRLFDLGPDVATELCKIASREGHTNKRIANALGVSPAMLRGLKEEARS